MRLNGARILLTGAAGGLGSALARRFAARGARLGLVDLNPQPLRSLCEELQAGNGSVEGIDADLSRAEGREAVVRWVERAWQGGVDVLVNNAGLLDFLPYERSRPERISALLAVNVEAAMLLTHAFLPSMLAQGWGRLVFVGSALGAIGMPYYASYCASKFALRGFAEALRRELEGTGVGVTYVGPRAMKTAINGPEVLRMAQETGMAMDDPEKVADRIVKAVERGAAERHIGFPERLFVRINGAMPRLVDMAMKGERRKMAPYARREA